ncbi:MAG: glycosyltransferase family 2 protein [Bacteroidota bacterium]
MDCSTIIVSYNTFELTEEAVRSALDGAKGLQHEVIVVDNNSPDQSAERLQEAFPEAEFPHVIVVANTHNPGFAAANNQGAALATGRILFFLNPDTIVLDDAVARLVEYIDAHPKAGAVGPYVLNTDQTDQPSLQRFPTFGYLLDFYLPVGSLFSGASRRLDYVPPQSEPAEIIKGCALAVKATTFQEVKGWDESYFMYSEESELCWALHIAGYTNYFLREARIVHHGGKSTEAMHVDFQVMVYQSRLQFIRRRKGRFMVAANRLLGATGFLGRAGLFRLMAQVRPERAEELKKRRQAASAIWRWFVFDYS